MNTNSNTYTIAYASIVVIIVAFLLAFLSGVLKGPSDANERIAKKKHILISLNIRGLSNEEVEAKYAEVVVQDAIIDVNGNVVNDGSDKEQAGFLISTKAIADNNLPIYICQVEGVTKYVIPMSGKGLWGAVYGYLAINDDKSTVYGSYFYHDSETAGLGALITEEEFQKQFQGKKLFYAAGATALSVVKKGSVKNAEYEADGISGATLTINGVSDMLHTSVDKYKAYLSEK